MKRFKGNLKGLDVGYTFDENGAEPCATDPEAEGDLVELPEVEDDDGPEPYCLICGGEGYVMGEDIASSYDYGWIDEDKVYPCTSCHGSGLAKEMTWC